MTANPTNTARLAAVLNILCFLPSGFSVQVLTKMFVRDDPAATAARILASESLFRLGFVSDLVAIMLFMSAMVLLYTLLAPSSRRVASIMLAFVIAGSVIQSLDAVSDVAALLVLKGVHLPAAEAQALAYVALRLHSALYQLALAFFGGLALLIGRLVLSATFLPRWLGIFMLIDGLGYLTFSLGTFLSPAFGLHVYPILPFATAAIGELPLWLWLIVRGVDIDRWRMQAAGSAATLQPAA